MTTRMSTHGSCTQAAHVLLRRTLYKLLKCTCLHCFKLKMLDAEVSASSLPCDEGANVQAMLSATAGPSMYLVEAGQQSGLL